ncbi:MAG: AAA family ATPase [Gammaproteobacteria bacterium]|nr:AAA family ATPase [Gammaproteobacteria bacterium]
MRRELLNHLINWKESDSRKPLVIRGARQVGKTSAVRQLGKTFAHCVELNFEEQAELSSFFSKNLDPAEILIDLQIFLRKKITPGETLLFFDEIQVCPRALLALRYFYEKMPELHVIAAGSLLEFAIELVGAPVGRVQFLHAYPMSFKEFLWAMDENFLVDAILNHDPHKSFQIANHEKALRLFGEYIAVGGMPEAVLQWREHKDYLRCQIVHDDLITAYKQDFEKYARKSQIKYVEHVFKEAPLQLCQQFQFSKMGGDFRKRELSPALTLLEKANIVTRVQQVHGRGFPIGAEADPHYFKIILLDVALAQTLLGAIPTEWILDTQNAFINKGAVAESFVGQELMAYHNPRQEAPLYYWQRNKRGSEAEIDYLLEKDAAIIPIEVKGGKGSTLKSMHSYLQTHPDAPYGIRFSTQNFSAHEKIISYPLYAVMLAVSAKTVRLF